MLGFKLIHANKRVPGLLMNEKWVRKLEICWMHHNIIRHRCSKKFYVCVCLYTYISGVALYSSRGSKVPFRCHSGYLTKLNCLIQVNICQYLPSQIISRYDCRVHTIHESRTIGSTWYLLISQNDKVIIIADRVVGVVSMVLNSFPLLCDGYPAFFQCILIMGTL